jgi:hypothetical protein
MINLKSSFYPLLAAVLLSTMLPGCLSFTTKPTGLEPAAFDIKYRQYEVIGESEGESSSFTLLWFFPVTRGLSYKEAVDEAVARKQGDNLIEVESYHERQWWIVGTIEVLTVKGKVIRYTD